MTGIVLMFAFMLIPIWIPLISLTVGAVLDRVSDDEQVTTLEKVRSNR